MMQKFSSLIVPDDIALWFGKKENRKKKKRTKGKIKRQMKKSENKRYKKK